MPPRAECTQVLATLRFTPRRRHDTGEPGRAAQRTGRTPQRVQHSATIASAVCCFSGQPQRRDARMQRVARGGSDDAGAIDDGYDHG